jgi:hypothetical protein
MKIKECSVIDNKVIDEMITECKQRLMRDNITFNEDVTITVKLSTLKHIKSHLKPLEPIVRDAWNCGEEIVQHEIHLDEFCHHNCDHINPKYITVDQYINQTEI